MLTSSDRSGGDSSTFNQKAPIITSVDDDESIDHCTSHHSEPIIEYPPSPVAGPEPMKPLGGDIEDLGCDSKITGTRWNGREFSMNLHKYVSEDDLKVVASFIPQIGSIPTPKEKIAIDLRTIHLV